MTLLLMAGHLPVHRLRVLILRACGADVHSTATVYHGFEVRAARGLTIGARSHIGNGSVLDARGGLYIGSDVNLSSDVQIWTAQHVWDDPDFAYQEAAVDIGDCVWLGPRVVVLPGVTIGREAVVAAGAVVTSNVPERSLVGGIPARFLRTRRPTNYRLAPARRKVWWW